MSRYQPGVIEPKWQAIWDERQTFKTPEIDPGTPKYYALGMFPYPSGSGLHVGHPESYTALDIVSRYKRKLGFNVLHPMGWDAFGLPAERAAVRDGRHPRDITRENIANFKQQLKALGFSYDWDREINTSEPEYYKWTQWIFLKLYDQGLAYLAEVPVNWCPAQGTVLANEEVQDGRYVETGDPVERRLMKQWMLKITVYAQRLLDDLEDVDWPEHVKEMQRQWIGRSEGAEVSFAVDGSQSSFKVFTTRPDTLFGATYCVLAPEHALVDQITTDAQKAEVQAYVVKAKNRSERDRQAGGDREKTGVFTGAYATNPVNGAKLPIWVADYVLITYGTGAIMAVPAHDERDHAFAKTFELPIIEVVQSPADHDAQESAWSGDGLSVNSGSFDGLKVDEFKRRIIDWLEAEGHGKGRIQFKLRDWLFSRQRYWGEPFPVLLDEAGNPSVVDPDALPVTLPHIDAYKPTADGQPPLARAGQDWLFVDADGKQLTRETNTMPQWAGSCWYYLRYMDPHNTELPFSEQAEKYWGPVDLYIGGVEHAVLHLLYARFWHKVLFDCGLVSTPEPFKKLFNQGMILAYSFRDANGKYYYPEQVEQAEDGSWVTKEGAVPVETKIEKMSKSRFNVVNPNDVVAEYGADALRIYEMFMGPLEQVKPWQMSGVEGVYRFLARAWRLFIDEDSGELHTYIRSDVKADADLRRSLHTAIQQVTHGIEELRFNGPVSRMMEFVKLATARKELPKHELELFVQILAPYAPHIAEELWEKLGRTEPLATFPWPKVDPSALTQNTVKIAVQVQGKLRGTLEAPKDASKDELLVLAKEIENVARFLDGMSIVKEIVVPGRLINFVVRPG